MIRVVAIPAYPYDVRQLGILGARQVNGMVFIDDGLHLHVTVGDVLEGRAAVHHITEDATQRPHVTLHTDLKHQQINLQTPVYFRKEM